MNQIRVGLKVTVITWTFQTCWQSTKMEKWLPKNKTNSIFVLDIYFYTYKLININHNRLSECFNRILGRTLHRGSFSNGSTCASDGRDPSVVTCIEENDYAYRHVFFYFLTDVNFLKVTGVFIQVE